MNAADTLEQTVPGLAALLAKEQQNRGIAFAQLVNPTLTHTVCGIEIRPLTPADRLALQLIGNAFFNRVGEPLAGDVFAFLWMLSPARTGTRLQRFFTARKIRRQVERLELDRSRYQIQKFLAWQMQDRAESTAHDGIDYGKWIHWAAFDAGFWINVHGGFTLESYLRTPYIVLQQLFRVWRVAHPRLERDARGELKAESPEFMNASDGLITDWVRLQREQVVAHILAQTTRLPE